MSLATDLDAVLGEINATAGLTNTWTPSDGSGGAGYSLLMTGSGNTGFDQLTADGFMSNDGFVRILRKSLVVAISPNRPPIAGDTLTNSAGKVFEITRVQDSEIGGFYRLTCAGRDQI